MSAGSISLESSIRTCKVDTGWANKIESDRFLNNELMVCPIWNGLDTAGRSVSFDSFYTKTPGCNSAEDRVVVENNQRPQYMEYINLSANGIDASIYGDDEGSKKDYGDSLPWNQVGKWSSNFNYPADKAVCQKNMQWSGKKGEEPMKCYGNVNNITGQFGQQFGATVYPPCGIKSCGGYDSEKKCPGENVYDLGQYQRKQMSQREMADYAQALRKQQFLEEGFIGNQFRRNSGF